MKKAIIIGAGTYGQVYSEYIRDTKEYEIIGFLDDDESKLGKTFCNLEVLGKLNMLNDLHSKEGTSVFAPIGNNSTRIRALRMAQELKFETPNFIHPLAYLHRTVILGNAVYILPNSNIMPHTIIADFVMISQGVNIAHHVTIERGCFFSQACTVGASLTIHENSFIGIASTIMTGVEKVGKNALVGAGAVVISNIPENAVLVGNPARILRYQDKKQFLQ